MADDKGQGVRPGIYSSDYFSNSQAAIYIADIFVDEITSFDFYIHQRRRPLYGYADQFYRQLSKGQVLVEGNFTINFKEAGYLWLIQNEYKRRLEPGSKTKLSPFANSSEAVHQNIEKIINNEIEPADKYQAFGSLAEVYASLGGFSSITRAKEEKTTEGKTLTGEAEGIFEDFENFVWGNESNNKRDDVGDNRSADDPDLNPFDVYIMYGDFMGDDRANHTIIKLVDVSIVGSGQRFSVDDASPIQEMYNFLAKMRV